MKQILTCTDCGHTNTKNDWHDCKDMKEEPRLAKCSKCKQAFYVGKEIGKCPFCGEIGSIVEKNNVVQPTLYD